MDALAQGYGSDSSKSEHESCTKKGDKKEEEEPKQKEEGKATLHNLLGVHYSDDDESSSSSNDCASNKVNGHTLKLKRGPIHDDNDEDGSTFSSQLLSKKHKLNDLKKRVVFSTPRLVSRSSSAHDSSSSTSSTINNPFESLILFSKDYISSLLLKQHQHHHHQQQQHRFNNIQSNHEEEQEQKILSNKLDALYNHFHGKSTSASSRSYSIANSSNNPNGENNTTFANQLKHQKEFGNPHLFPSIITHFGIDSRGSNGNFSCLDDDNYHNSSSGDDGTRNVNGDEKKHDVFGVMSVKFGKFEYIENIVQKEEENRIRNAQQQQQQHGS